MLFGIDIGIGIGIAELNNLFSDNSNVTETIKSDVSTLCCWQG